MSNSLDPEQARGFVSVNNFSVILGQSLLPGYLPVLWRAYILHMVH